MRSGNCGRLLGSVMMGGCNVMGQINEFVKRARQAKIHAHIIGHLKKEMPAMMGKQKAQKRLIENLEDEFAKVPVLTYSWPTHIQALQHLLHCMIFLDFYCGIKCFLVSSSSHEIE